MEYGLHATVQMPPADPCSLWEGHGGATVCFVSRMIRRPERGNEIFFLFSVILLMAYIANIGSIRQKERDQ